MRILALHCDYLRFEALKKAMKEPGDTPQEGVVEVKDPLVVFTAREGRR